MADDTQQPSLLDDESYQQMLRKRLMDKMDQYDRGLQFDSSTAGRNTASEGGLSRDLILNQALAKSAAQVGAINGKTANTDVTDTATKELLGNQMQGLDMGQKDAESRDKLQQYLMGKMLDQEGSLARTKEVANKTATEAATKKEGLTQTAAEKEAERKFTAGEKAKDRAAAAALAETKAENKPEKDIKPDQSGAATYGRRVEQAEKDFESVAAGGYDPTTLGSAVQRKLPGGVQSEAAKLQEQAERNFINAILRRESGSAIAASEFDSAEKQYFPRAGDTPKVVAQKKRNRDIALNGLKVAAGPAWDKVLPPDQAVAATPPPASGTAQAGTAKPKKIVQDGHEYILNEKTGKYE